MAEQEKKVEKNSEEDALMKALKALKGEPPPTDTEEWREYINLDNEFRELFKKFKKK